MKLSITICATASYCYAMRSLARRVQANLTAAEWTTPGLIIISGDESKQVKGSVKFWTDTFEGWQVKHIAAASERVDEPNYKGTAQLIIATLRTAAFSAARAWGADYCWSLDSDTLPPANSLRCMLDMLNFDRGYYKVSTCPYPNEAFLGGRGTPFRHIAEDFDENERTLPDDLKAEIAALKKEASESKENRPSDEWLARKKAVDERVRECPPTGNIFKVIAEHGWRRRGWLEHAYPAIGAGAVVPSDWCGFGCTLMSKEALALADFDGYRGDGTEDLFVVWHRWFPAGLRINVIPHCPCDHVIWGKKKGGDVKEYTLIRAFHETQGECVGHLRTEKVPWVEF